MRKKIGYWATIAVIILLVFLQNSKFLMTKTTFSYNLICIPIVAEKTQWTAFKDFGIELWNVVFFLGCFLSGVILTWIYYFFIQIKNKMTITNLNKNVNTHLAKITELEKELEGLQEGSPLAQKEVIDISDEEK